VNSQQIEYFLSAVRELNFTKVAEEFYTSQPTVSRQIALLEEELGFALFTRDKGSLRLTAGGAIMARELVEASRIIRNAIAQVGLVSDDLEGELSIGYVSGMNTDLYVYPPTIEFMGEYPAIKVTMESMSVSGLRNNLDSGKFDIIYTFDFELPSIQNALYIKCYIAEPIIAISSSHPLAMKENLTIQDFSGQTFLLPSPTDSNTGRTDTLDLLKTLGVTDFKLRSMNGNESMMFGVRSGVGAAVLDTSMDLIHDNRYRYIPLPKGEEFSTLEIMAVWKKDNLNPIMPIYLEKLKKTIAADSLP